MFHKTQFYRDIDKQFKMKGLLRMHTYTYLVIHSEVDLLENVIYQKLVYIWQKKQW